MKILHCIAQLPMKTGSGVYFSTLINGFSKLETQNAALFGIQQPFTYEEASLNTIKNFAIEFMTDNLNFPISGMSDIMPYQSTIYSEMTSTMYKNWIEAFKNKLLKAKKEFNPDIIIVHHLFILASLVCEIFTQCKIIGICHGTDIRQIEKNSWIKEKYITNLDKLDKVLVVSHKNIPDIHTLFNINKNKIHLVGGGFNKNIFNTENTNTELKTQADQIKLVYAGKIADSKGVFELAKALPIILTKYPNTKLTIIGNATEAQTKRLYSNANNTKALTLHHAESQLVMSNILKQSDIFILPSYYETLGLIAIEALACGLYIVSTEIDGLINLLGPKVNKSGIIEYVHLPPLYNIDQVSDKDKPQFVQNLAAKIILQIQKVYDNKNIYHTVSKEISTHSWEHIIHNILTIIKNT